jgi:RHS repeat-associated protein
MFTGKERDAETGLDYFGERCLGVAQGRFTSPGAPFADQSPDDPESWNLFSNARNNPLILVDATGNRSNKPSADTATDVSGSPCVDPGVHSLCQSMAEVRYDNRDARGYCYD